MSIAIQCDPLIVSRTCETYLGNKYDPSTDEDKGPSTSTIRLSNVVPKARSNSDSDWADVPVSVKSSRTMMPDLVVADAVIPENKERSASVPLLPLVRKKSGQLVKSSLKLSSMTRPMSMVLLNNKSVRFATHLANVKTFDGKASPCTLYTTETTPLSSLQGFDSPEKRRGFFDFNWDDDEISDITSDTSSDEEADSAPVQFEFEYLNFKPPMHILDKQNTPCYLQSLKLAPERDALVGFVMVRNIAFEKKLSIKLTDDNWKSNIILNDTTYCKSFSSIGFDQFKFVILLHNRPRSNIRLQFVIRYDVNSTSYWDNNNMKNYSISLKPYATMSKNHLTYNCSIPQFEDLVNNLINYQKSGELESFANADLPKPPLHNNKPRASRSSSELHFRYNLNYKNDCRYSTEATMGRNSSYVPCQHFTRSQPFAPVNLDGGSTTINTSICPKSADHASKAKEEGIDTLAQRQVIKSSFSNSDVERANTKHSNAYRPKQHQHEPLSPLEINKASFNSQSYANLLQSYCFFNGSDNATPNAFVNTIPSVSTSSTFQSYSDSIYT